MSARMVGGPIRSRAAPLPALATWACNCSSMFAGRDTGGARLGLLHPCGRRPLAPDHLEIDGATGRQGVSSRGRKLERSSGRGAPAPGCEMACSCHGRSVGTFRGLFTSLNVDRFLSKVLVKQLRELADFQWADLALTEGKLAQMLEPFGVALVASGRRRNERRHQNKAGATCASGSREHGDVTSMTESRSMSHQRARKSCACAAIDSSTDLMRQRPARPGQRSASPRRGGGARCRRRMGCGGRRLASV
jgi:hypothetical protein